ncbi:MAG: hypothetical protein V1806_05890 [Pseudomonadota bacterium]
MAEVNRAQQRLGKEDIRVLASWLEGLCRKMASPDWPPVDPGFWGKVAGALKGRRDQLASQLRAKNLRTPEQNRMIWALVRERFGDDRTILDAWLKKFFPKAVRKDESGNKVPSTRMLTKNDATELIKMLQDPYYVPTNRRARS